MFSNEISDSSCQVKERTFSRSVQVFLVSLNVETTSASLDHSLLVQKSGQVRRCYELWIHYLCSWSVSHILSHLIYMVCTTRLGW